MPDRMGLYNLVLLFCFPDIYLGSVFLNELK